MTHPDRSFLNLALIVAIPFLICFVVVLHDPAVSRRLLVDFLIVLGVSGVIAVAVGAFMNARERRSGRG
jgi:hypothetical protein